MGVEYYTWMEGYYRIVCSDGWQSVTFIDLVF